MDLGSAAKRRPVLLRLYVAAESPNSARAFANLHAVCNDLPSGSVKVETVDVLNEPQRALDDGVFVSPMLVRLSPPPVVRLIGDLRDASQVRGLLGLE